MKIRLEKYIEYFLKKNLHEILYFLLKASAITRRFPYSIKILRNTWIVQIIACNTNLYKK
jgi:hypothetical protein